MTDLIAVPAVVAPRWPGRSLVAVIDTAAAIERLPGAPHLDPYERLTMAFLVGYPTNGARGYRSDLQAWGACAPPLARIPSTLDVIMSTRGYAPSPARHSPARASPWRRRRPLDDFLRVEVLRLRHRRRRVELLPAANVRRPKVSEDSRTIGLDAGELVRLLDLADAHCPRSSALVTLLAYNGVRIDEALSG